MSKKHGKIAGIPYDFRSPTWKRAKQRVWNKKDKRVFTPKSFGIGWTLNFRNPKSFLIIAAIVAFILIVYKIAGLI